MSTCSSPKFQTGERKSNKRDSPNTWLPAWSPAAALGHRFAHRDVVRLRVSTRPFGCEPVRPHRLPRSAAVPSCVGLAPWSLPRYIRPRRRARCAGGRRSSSTVAATRGTARQVGRLARRPEVAGDAHGPGRRLPSPQRMPERSRDLTRPAREGSDGTPREWHSRGQGFDPPQPHQPDQSQDGPAWARAHGPPGPAEPSPLFVESSWHARDRRAARP